MQGKKRTELTEQIKRQNDKEEPLFKGKKHIPMPG